MTHLLNKGTGNHFPWSFLSSASCCAKSRKPKKTRFKWDFGDHLGHRTEGTLLMLLIIPGGCWTCSCRSVVTLHHCSHLLDMLLSYISNFFTCKPNIFSLQLKPVPTHQSPWEEERAGSLRSMKTQDLARGREGQCHGKIIVSKFVEACPEASKGVIQSELLHVATEHTRLHNHWQ